MAFRLTIELTEKGKKKTEWRHKIEFKAFPKFRPLGWLLEKVFLRRKMQKELERVVNEGKSLLE